MSTILISSFTNEAASKSKGMLLRDKLIEKLKLNEKNIVVDFTGITKFASPFFNNSFASLVLIYGPQVVTSIKLDNISQVGMDTYQTSINNAMNISDNKKHVVEINRIIDNAPKKVSS